jgi:hypothetical protein
MAGGDCVLQHNTIRDLVGDYCQRGGLRPELETSGLLRATSCQLGVLSAGIAGS